MTLSQMILLMLQDKQPRTNSKDAKLFNLIRRILLDNTLTELKFSSNEVEEIGTDGMANIAQALQNNTTVKAFIIDSCEQKYQYDQEGYRQVSTIDNTVIATIAKTLSTNTTIEALSLFGCHVTDEGAEALANALRQNKTLKTLNLRQNGELTVSGIEFFVTVLESGANTTLTALYLSETGYSNGAYCQMINRTFPCLQRNKNGGIQKQLMVNSTALVSSSVTEQGAVTTANGNNNATIKFSSSAS